MKTFKLICVAIVQLPRSVFNAFRYRHQRLPTAKALEAERLDRIRQPVEVLGQMNSFTLLAALRVFNVTIKTASRP